MSRGRHRRARPGASPSRSPTDRLAEALPALFGPSRRAAWRRFVIRRALAATLVLTGVAVAFSAGVRTAS